MARRRRKLTPFARFFLVMLVLVPAAFIGASLFNKEDPGENFQKVLEWFKPSSSDEETAPMPEIVPPPVQEETQPDAVEPDTPSSRSPQTQADTQDENRVRYLEQQMESMKQQLETLEERIRALEQESKRDPAVN
jgi:hypothetical protein